MSHESYLKELERVHKLVLSSLDEIKWCIDTGLLESMPSLITTIGELEVILSEHLRGEDQRFYKELRLRAIDLGQDALLTALDFFIVRTNEISRKAEDFFGSYNSKEKILSKQAGFVDNFNELREDIIKRNKSEEGSLFHIYKAYFF
ncbi:MAG: hypothetical protein KAT46_00595 [Deltaproteobacteria bacterium]|nr:hypothetical protein [Deltaproteobacteria bacterium]